MNARMRIFVALWCLAGVIGTSRAQNWVQLTPTTGDIPAPRANAAAIYDSSNHRLLIFGGRAATGNLNDVWGFDLTNNSWSNLTPGSGAMPEPRFTANGVYNFSRQQMIIWSGQGSSFFNDVWAFELNTGSWSQFIPTGPEPNIRYGAASIFDPKTNELVTFAGFTDAGRFDDTWRFNIDSEIWKQVSAVTHPEKRCLHSASYDALKHHMIVYGGQTNGPRGDIWALDLATNAWTDLTPASSPAGRYFPTNVFDTAGNRVIIFGGNLGTSKTNETWAFDLTKKAWQQIALTEPLPPAREGTVAIYIRAENRMVIFGGSDDTFFNDIWSLNNLASTTTVGSNSGKDLPASFRLLDSYPNPFLTGAKSAAQGGRSPSTTIRFDVPKPSQVTIKIYDMLGREVKTLIDRKFVAGSHAAVWDGRNNHQRPVASSVYFIRMHAGEFVQVRKLVLVR